jgi:hypothetical protein
MSGKFSFDEVATLRNELLGKGLDSFQVADGIKMFLAAYGYGVSPEAARNLAWQLECSQRTTESLRSELEASALMM